MKSKPDCVESTELVRRFVVPGKPVGYYAQGGRSKWRMSPDQRRRAEEYRAYQEKVRVYALQAGIKLPLYADKLHPLVIKTTAYFASGVHFDPENVRKGVADSLFYGGSGDKYTGGIFPPPLYDAVNPRVEVEIIAVQSGLGG